MRKGCSRKKPFSTYLLMGTCISSISVRIAFRCVSAYRCRRQRERRKNRSFVVSRKINRTTRTRFQPWQLISSLPNDLFPHMSSCDYASPAVIFQCNAVTAACYFKSLSTRKKKKKSTAQLLSR